MNKHYLDQNYDRRMIRMCFAPTRAAMTGECPVDLLLFQFRGSRAKQLPRGFQPDGLPLDQAKFEASRREIKDWLAK